MPLDLHARVRLWPKDVRDVVLIRDAGSVARMMMSIVAKPMVVRHRDAAVHVPVRADTALAAESAQFRFEERSLGVAVDTSVATNIRDILCGGIDVDHLGAHHGHTTRVSRGLRRRMVSYYGGP